MLSCMSSQDADKKSNKKIESDLKKDSKKNGFKILILGTGDSGKSTFVKNMAYLYGSNKEEDLAPFATILRGNCLDAMQILLTNLTEKQGLPDGLQPLADQITDAAYLTPNIAEAVASMWKHPELQGALKKLADSKGIVLQGGIFGAKFYLDNALRFAEPSFIPTKDDTLMARRKTVGIAETNFVFQGNYFTLVDVGGQRSERKKWLNCFDVVTAIIFLAAINEYDMTLEEDQATNRLLESIKLWKSLTGSPYFRSTPFILFLNKSDLFQEKIKIYPLEDVFTDFKKVISTPEFAKFDLYTKSYKYIGKQYASHFGGCRFSTHLTSVLDTQVCKNVFLAVQEQISSEILKLF